MSHLQRGVQFCGDGGCEDTLSALKPGAQHMEAADTFYKQQGISYVL